MSNSEEGLKTNYIFTQDWFTRKYHQLDTFLKRIKR